MIGIVDLKRQQDENLPEGEQYIRYIAEFPALGQLMSSDVPDVDDMDDARTPFRIIICMSKQNSIRLLSAHYVQSDIGFKRIAGHQEFELGGLDQSSRISAFLTALLSPFNKLTSIN